jgi:CRP-like cAMP-binding protein
LVPEVGRLAAEVRAVATQDTGLLVLPPESIRTLFESSPRLARDTDQSLDVRRKALQSARNALRRR